MKNAPQVAVVGSLNVDLIAALQRLPAPGETVAANRLHKLFGGKGANQAVAAARSGIRVEFIGALGADADGKAYRTRLKTEGIGTTGIRDVKGSLTGTALIGVDAKAENLIMVAPEANGKLTAADVRQQRRKIEQSGALLLQLEVPLPAVTEAIRIANRAQVPVVLNPSPLNSKFPWGRLALRAVIVNETEAEQIFEHQLTLIGSELGHWRMLLADYRVDWLIITRGAKSTLCLSREHFHALPALNVKPVDTVGAGDAFAGVFTASLAGGASISEAVRLGNCAGALATLKSGAQEAIPAKVAILRARKRLKT